MPAEAELNFCGEKYGKKTEVFKYDLIVNPRNVHEFELSGTSLQYLLMQMTDIHANKDICTHNCSVVHSTG